MNTFCRAEESGFFEYFISSLEAAALRPIHLPETIMGNFALLDRISDCTSIRNYCYTKHMVRDILVDLFDMLNGFEFNSARIASDREKGEVAVLLDHYINSFYSLTDAGSYRP